MASITGSVILDGDPDDWIACAFDADTHAFAGVAAVAAGEYTITGLTAGKAYVVVCRPKSGGVWTAGRGTVVGDYTVPTDPATTPYIYQATTAPVGDPYFANVSLLLHCDGSNSSTTFTDVTGKTVTPYGNARISTAQSKFGGSSGVFDGTGDYLSLGATHFGSGSFMIECWVRFLALGTGNRTLFSQYSGAQASRTLFDVRNTKQSIFSGSNGGVSGSTTLVTDRWYHLAFVRAGTVCKGYLDGALEVTHNNFQTPYATTTLFGSYPSASGDEFSGYLDELRLTDMARYTDAFTPSGSAYPDAQNALTDSTEPTWPETPGSTVVDNNVTWTNMGQLLDPLIAGPLIAA